MGIHKKSSRDKWLKLAKKIVIQKGVQAINIDVLSNKLGVAKTSFYHFFNSKTEFIELLFKTGIKEGTDNIISQVNKVHDPKKKITRLLEIVFNENLENELFLRRLRTYGLHKKSIADIVNDTENRRIAFLKNIFIDLGMDEESADNKSRAFYIYSLGLWERIYADQSILSDKEKIYSDLKRLLYPFQI